jgi:hypothetical protein
MLDIKVETINSRADGCRIIPTIKRTRAIPTWVPRSKSAVKEVGELNSLLIRSNLVVASLFIIDSTNAEEYLDTTVLTVRNALHDDIALGEEV